MLTPKLRGKEVDFQGSAIHLDIVAPPLVGRFSGDTPQEGIATEKHLSFLHSPKPDKSEIQINLKLQITMSKTLKIIFLVEISEIEHWIFICYLAYWAIAICDFKSCQKTARLYNSGTK